MNLNKSIAGIDYYVRDVPRAVDRLLGTVR